MKKLSLVLALLAMVGGVLVTGCKKEEPAAVPPAEAATNAPAPAPAQ